MASTAIHALCARRDSPDSKRLGVHLLGVHALAAVIIVVVLAAARETAGSVQDVIRFISLLHVTLLIWALASWRMVTGRLFDVYTLLYISTFLFNSGYSVLELVGIASYRSPLYPDELAVSAMTFVAASQYMMHLGALIAALSRGNASSTHSDAQVCVTMRRTGMVLAGLGIGPTFANLRRGMEIVESDGYAGFFGRDDYVYGLAAWQQFLATLFIPGMILFFAGARGRRMETIVAWAIVVSYAGGAVLLGGRSAVLLPLTAMLWLHHRTRRPLPTLIVAVCIGAAMLFIPLVGSVRSTSGSARTDMAVLQESYRSMESPYLRVLRETGGSFQAIVRTMQLVPVSRPFDNGEGYLWAVAGVFPNLFWKVHPAAVRGNASDWLIREVDPDVASRGGGLGFSVIAEAYLNFAWWGIVVLLLLGYSLGRFTKWVDSGESTARIAVEAMLLSFLLSLARGESITYLRPIFWFCVAPYYFITRFSRGIRLRHLARKPPAGSSVR